MITLDELMDADDIVIFETSDDDNRDMAYAKLENPYLLIFERTKKTKCIVYFAEGNGKGFDMPGSFAELPRTDRLGLAGMEERARLLNGSLKVQSELDKGTLIIVEVPI